MLRSLKELIGYTLQASDGEVGKACDFFFDSAKKRIRYIVVDTAGRLPDRKVLVGTERLKSPDWYNESMAVEMTRNEVEEGPGLASHQPVSQRVEDTTPPSAWVPYWAPYAPSNSPYPIPIVVPGGEQETVVAEGDPDLRSIHEVMGYAAEARDGRAGQVEDFIVDDEDWSIAQVIIDTGHWLPGKKVALAAEWVGGFSWSAGEMALDLKKETIQEAPGFDPEEPVNVEHEVRRYDYLGRPHERV